MPASYGACAAYDEKKREGEQTGGGHGGEKAEKVDSEGTEEGKGRGEGALGSKTR